MNFRIFSLLSVMGVVDTRRVEALRHVGARRLQIAYGTQQPLTKTTPFSMTHRKGLGFFVLGHQDPSQT